MSISFSTKARTLIALKPLVLSAQILPLCVFGVAEWQSNRGSCLNAVSAQLGDGPFIVRSSSSREDCVTRSSAGLFLSLPNIFLKDLERAVENVIASYGHIDLDDEILIQPMLMDVICSGVGFSHDPNTCAPYRIVNWANGADTSVVTGGLGGRVWQQSALSKVPTSQVMRPIIDMIDELLNLFDGAPLDCEFAVTGGFDDSVLWLLQVRPLILNSMPQSNIAQAELLSLVEQKVALGMLPQPFLMGERNVFGVMPDWNPAEIIGIRPKPLALSLYRELITDSIWAYQRHNYGYRNLRSFPLMVNFFGLPYIDVRTSFNSFIPADLDEDLAGRLVDYYIDHLLSEPALHDKVEFNIVFSCYSFDLPKRLVRLANAGFTSKECELISQSLRHVTNHILCAKEGLVERDALKLNTLKIRREKLSASNMSSVDRIYWLLEDAKRYGTLPFAGLARAGFIAVQLLNSLETEGVLSKAELDAFVSSLSTVSRGLLRDRATLDKEEFLTKYGHLRPGTYDVLSPRYDEDPDLYFDWSATPSTPELAPSFTLTLSQKQKIMKLLEVHGLEIDVEGLIDFIKKGIELRELAKFYFTSNLSDAMSLMVEVGSDHGFSREDMAFCDVTIFRELYIGSEMPKDIISQSIERGRERYNQSLLLQLPPLITGPEDVWGFEWPEISPNFITQRKIVAPVVTHHYRERLAGAIVCIPRADPGFDWLFAYPIAGLITAWGGVNSHMAIRAGELGLPAVIGAGEELYTYWSSAQRLHLDCANRKVEILK